MNDNSGKNKAVESVKPDRTVDKNKRQKSNNSLTDSLSLDESISIVNE